MKIRFTKDGRMFIQPENNTETMALRHFVSKADWQADVVVGIDMPEN